MEFRNLVVTLLLTLVAVGCGYRDIRPTLPSRSLSQPIMASLRSKLENRSVAVHSFRALFSGSVSVGEQGFSARYAVVYKQPQQLRIEVLPTQGFYTLQLLTLSGEDVTFVDQVEKRATQSNKASTILAKEFGLPVPIEFFSYLLQGVVPPEILNSPSVQWFQSENGQYVLAEQNWRSYWEIDSSTMLLKRAQFRDIFSERLEIEFLYHSYSQVDGFSLVSDMEMNIPVGEGRVRLWFNQGSVNREIPEKLFSQRIPAGFDIRQE